MTSRRKSNISNFQSDTESVNSKDLIYVIRKHSQHSQHRPDDHNNLQILETKPKKHSIQTVTDDQNGLLWSIRDPHQRSQSQQPSDLLTSNRMNNDELMNRTSDEDMDIDKNEYAILKPNKLNASELEHRSNQYLNKRLPWYCESSSPIKWFKEYSNDQLPKVNYNQKLIEKQQQQAKFMAKNEQLINLDPNGYANMDFNNFDTNSVQTYVKSYPIKEPSASTKHVRTQPRIQQPQATDLRFVDQQPQDTIKFIGNHGSMGTISKPQSTQNHYPPFRYTMNDYNYNYLQKPQPLQWRKLSLPHVHSHLHQGHSKFLGSSRSSYGGRRSHTTKTRFKFNPFAGFYKPRSSDYAGLNEMFADSSVPGVREICHSDGYFRKFIWMIAFVLFSFLAVNDIQQLLSDFYSYPVTVDMRMRESRKLPFPAVTICNLNIVRYSALCNSTLNVSMPVELQEKLCGTNLSQMKNTSIEDINDILPDSDQSATTRPPFDDYLNYDDEIANEQTNGPETTVHPNRKKGIKPTHKPTKPKRRHGHRHKRSPSATGLKSHGQPGSAPNLNSNLNKASPSPPEFNPEIESFDLTEREEKELQENLTTWLAVMANKNKNLTFTLGHQFDDMVLRCTIKSSNCTHPNSFVSSFTPTEGNCYTFVAKTNMNPTHTYTPITFGTTVPVTSTTMSETTHTDTSTTTPRPTTSSTTMGTEQPKMNPPLQAELFSMPTKPPDSTTRTTQPPERLTQDPGIIIGAVPEPSGHHQIETILAGADHGLELVINLEKAEYLPGTSQIGALVMLHSPDDFGISASEAIMVSPECATYIGLKMVRISRLPAPYPEQCIDVWPKGLQRKSMMNVSYSQQACIKICLQKTIQTRCKCQSAFLEQVEFNGTEFRICDTRKRNTRRCVEEVMLRPENKLEDCKCPPRCQVIQYEKTVSIARWPTREDRVSFDRGTKDINISNVAKVVVYFQTMTLQEVTQQAAWTTAKLFFSLGGFMGMYVGFSFLSLFEVFEIMCRRAWYAMTRRTPKFKVVASAVLSAIIAKNTLQKSHRKSIA